MKKTKRPEPLSWTPVRRGAIYCAPACGRGCTHKEYLAAKALAERTAKALGPGWEPALNENLGWHARARKGAATVYPPSRDETDYWADFNPGPQFTAYGRTAKAALRGALTQASETITRISMELEKVLR